ncbi:MAG: MBL fold metallo-hydrolase [Bacteroidales bacterium]|nr:MBL fold metallo-hydrolase [Bacteroidales bacterium]
MWIILISIVLIILGIILFMNQPKFGKTPRGERLERVKNSKNYKDGKFQNQIETPQLTSDKSFVASVYEFIFRDSKTVRPDKELPVIKTNLHQLDKNKDLLIWLGHSSYFIQIESKRILVDPVFYSAAPLAFLNKPFSGVEIYKPEDIPHIDYLIITHDHWDHLDYETVLKLKERTGKVICGLGVGEHFEYWGFDKEKIIEMDWYENVDTGDNLSVYCLPSRHFSGRGLSPNQSLWASYMLETLDQKIYISGDGGYDNRFQEISKQFPEIDLAILENGQYDNGWRYIHLMPEEVAKAAKELNAKRLLTVHHSKYALANHPWNAPLKDIAEANDKESLHLITPRIGEVVFLKDTTQTFQRWWE